PGAQVERVRVQWLYEGTEPVDLRVFTPERNVAVAASLAAGSGWQDQTIERVQGAAKELDVRKQTDYGTGLARISGVTFLDAAGHDVVEITHGDPLTVRLSVRVDPALVDRHVTFVLGFARHGTPYSAFVHREALLLPSSTDCVIEVAFDAVCLGSGKWYVNI